MSVLGTHTQGNNGYCGKTISHMTKDAGVNESLVNCPASLAFRVSITRISTYVYIYLNERVKFT